MIADGLVKRRVSSIKPRRIADGPCAPTRPCPPFCIDEASAADALLPVLRLSALNRDPVLHLRCLRLACHRVPLPNLRIQGLAFGLIRRSGHALPNTAVKVA